MTTEEVRRYLVTLLEDTSRMDRDHRTVALNTSIRSLISALATPKEETSND